MAEKAPRGAVLQMEFARKRVGDYPNSEHYGPEKHSGWKWRALLHQAVTDVLTNGGTLVIVATPETVTIVQRPDAEDL